MHVKVWLAVNGTVNNQYRDGSVIYCSVAYKEAILEYLLVNQKAG